MSSAPSDLHGDAAAYASRTRELSQSIAALQRCAAEHETAGRALVSAQHMLNTALAEGSSGYDQLSQLEKVAQQARATEERLKLLLDKFRS